jgi:diaminohydroxyphosphoribosylaminopyrimidine deaminase/5-amino-6-(5-phosphoribosylamino)uracil reductase
MHRALELAQKGRYGCSPNPMVGAVVLDADGILVGEGHHAVFGGPHAEVAALEAAGSRSRGGCLYVTLEPCNHHGKTPPCVEAIVAAGIRRVVVALRDPNTEAAGGLEALIERGIEATVLGGPEVEQARRLNRRWLRWAESGRPWVTLKAAVSLDGRIATRSGQSQWITGEAARRRSLELREEHDAILVGVGTVVADDPRLTRRLGLNPSQQWCRIVLDSGLRTPPGAAVVRKSPQQTLLVHTPRAEAEARQGMLDAGVGLLEVPARADGRVDLGVALKRLAARGMAAVLVEGGAEVHGSLVDAGLVDEVVFFVAPTLLGGPAPAAVAGQGVAELSQARRWRFETVQRHGDDVELHALIPEEACSQG